MNATELYEQLVTGITDALLDEADKFRQGGIVGIRNIGAAEAGPRRPASGARDPRDISDATKTEHARLRTMLDTNTATRKDGTTFTMPKGLRDKIQQQHDAISAMIGQGAPATGRDVAAARLDSIMVAPEKAEREPTGEEAFAALFK